MQEINETQQQNCVGLTVQREARCTNDLLSFGDDKLLTILAREEGITPENGWEFRQGAYFWRNRDGHMTMNSWNPLTNDGDALRLAVKYGFFSSTDGFLEFQAYYSDEIRKDCQPTQATRKAIILLAVQTGRTRT